MNSLIKKNCVRPVIGKKKKKNAKASILLMKMRNCLYSIFKYCEETLWDFFGGCSEIISSGYPEKTIAPEGICVNLSL